MTQMPQKPAASDGVPGRTTQGCQTEQETVPGCVPGSAPCEPLSPWGGGWGACEGDVPRVTPGSVQLEAVSLTLSLAAADNSVWLLGQSHCSQPLPARAGRSGNSDLGPDPHPELNFLSVTYQLTKFPEDSASGPHLASPGVSINFPPAECPSRTRCVASAATTPSPP